MQEIQWRIGTPHRPGPVTPDEAIWLVSLVPLKILRSVFNARILKCCLHSIAFCLFHQLGGSSQSKTNDKINYYVFYILFTNPPFCSWILPSVHTISVALIQYLCSRAAIKLMTEQIHRHDNCVHVVDHDCDASERSFKNKPNKLWSGPSVSIFDNKEETMKDGAELHDGK